VSVLTTSEGRSAANINLVTRTEPAIRVWPSTEKTEAVVLVLHGGREHGQGVVHPLRLAYLRMVPIAKAIARRTAGRGVATWLLRNRVQGWNAPELAPVADAKWALEQIRERHPGVPVVLVGHSMGARVALRVAHDPAVTAVCALAPWTPPGEPVDQLAGRLVLIAHGDKDRMTDPRASLAYAQRAKAVTDQVIRYDVRGEGHAMLRRADAWERLVNRFVLGALELEPFEKDVTEAMTEPPPGGLRIPL
jgi:alpha/beta superfamily hydrolase